MSLSQYLRGTRPNPGAGAWHLRHRHAEGGPWTVVARTSTHEGLLEELAAGTAGWPVVAAPGDLVEVLGPEGKAVPYGVARDGSVRPLPPSADAWTLFAAVRGTPVETVSWVERWERSTHPRAMLWAARVAVPRRRRVLVSAACVRMALPRIMPGEPRPQAALEAAERWARGEETPEAVQRAAEEAWAVYDPETRDDAAGAAAIGAAGACYDVAFGVFGENGQDRSLADAVEDAELALAADLDEGPEADAAFEAVRATTQRLVRAAIPVRELVQWLVLSPDERAASGESL